MSVPLPVSDYQYIRPRDRATLAQKFTYDQMMRNEANAYKAGFDDAQRKMIQWATLEAAKAYKAGLADRSRFI